MSLPPKAKNIPHRTEQLGRVRTDDYAWMKDDNWQKILRDPALIKADVREHLTEENAWRAKIMAATEPLQTQMFEEMKGRIKPDDASVPSPDGAWSYFSRYESGAQHPVFARFPADQPDRVFDLLDADALAKGKAYFQIAATDHSPDHSLFAWAVDEQGSEVHRVFVKDIAAGLTLPGPVESSTGDFCFSPDSAWLFWVHRDDNGRSDAVYRRPARGGGDVLVYKEPDEGFFVSVHVTTSRAFIVIGAGNHETSEAWIIPAADPTATPKVAAVREDGVQYDLEHWGGRWMIRTNADGAVDFKIVEAPEDAPSRANWKDWAPHRPGRFIVGTTARRDFFIQLVRDNAANRALVTRRADASQFEIAFEEEAFALSLAGGYEFATPVIRYIYESPATPKQWWDHDLATGQRTLRKTQEIPSGHDAAAYETRRLFATATDGAQIPITLLMKRGTPLDGSAPLLLYGYGSYGISMDASFSIQRLSLVDRGWIWAIAHVRGGSEKGWGWFLAGRKFNKKNTFTDFIACAEHLHGLGSGAPARTVAYGGSAGGMLMGAVANMRPDLFAGIIAAVPFVDVLNTMSDTSLPLTPPEWPEWGNPLEDAAAYDYIASYSPYDNITAQPYPAILATGGLSDPRVTWWEPEKWVAKLREHTTGDAPILLKINMEAGHGGASGRFDYLKDVALDYAFAVWAVQRGWKQPAPAG